MLKSRRASELQTAPAATRVPSLLTPAEAADILRVSRRRIYALVDRGTLPAFKFGRSLRIAEEDILALLQRSRVMVDSWR